MLTLDQSVINTGQLDFLDISFWDVFRQAPHLGEENKQPSRLFIDCYTELDWKNTKLLVSGKIKSADDIIWCLDKGADFVALGKTAILHHDFPNQLRKDIDFLPVGTPVSRDYLRNEGLGRNLHQLHGVTLGGVCKLAERVRLGKIYWFCGSICSSSLCLLSINK